jgi:predicted DNA-binding ribbon-helix-helix protein
MTSALLKRSVVIDGRKTSVSIEDDFWDNLKEIAHQQHKTVSELVAGIDAERKAERKADNLSSAIRLFVLEYDQDDPPY